MADRRPQSLQHIQIRHFSGQPPNAVLWLECGVSMVHGNRSAKKNSFVRTDLKNRKDAPRKSQLSAVLRVLTPSRETNFLCNGRREGPWHRLNSGGQVPGQSRLAPQVTPQRPSRGPMACKLQGPCDSCSDHRAVQALGTARGRPFIATGCKGCSEKSNCRDCGEFEACPPAPVPLAAADFPCVFKCRPRPPPGGTVP